MYWGASERRVADTDLDGLLFSADEAFLYPRVFAHLLEHHNNIQKANAGVVDLRYFANTEDAPPRPTTEHLVHLED